MKPIKNKLDHRRHFIQALFLDGVVLRIQIGIKVSTTHGVQHSNWSTARSFGMELIKQAVE
jgi:hypothetical protein